MAITIKQFVDEANSWLVPTTGHALLLDYARNKIFPRSRFGHANQHLETSVDKSSGHPTVRQEPLSPETLVFGDWLLFTDLNHDDYSWLSEHGSREELQDEILGGAGVFNAFTECQVAFEYGKVLPYTITYCDKTGDRRIFDIRLRDTTSETLASHDHATERYRQPVLTWTAS